MSSGLAVPFLAAALLAATAYEEPRSVRAVDLLELAELGGPHHAVADVVKTEGYLYLFQVTTDYGALEAEGTTMLRVRLSELVALAELEKVSKSEVFVKSVGTSVLNVGKGVTAAVKDPVATAKGMGTGLKRLGTNLGRKGKRTADKAVASVKEDDEDAPKSADAGSEPAAVGVADSMLGVNSAARKWAQKLAVDPYTSNAILKKALVDLGRIDAAGSLATKIVVPIPPVVGVTAKVGGLVWSQDPEALLKGNEQRLKDLGVSAATIKKLYLSKGFTLSLHTRLARSLSEMKVPGCADYVATAAEADREREAVFFVESAEMLARLRDRESILAVLPDSRGLLAKTQTGRAVLLLPLDTLSWSRAYDESLTEITRRARDEMHVHALELRTTGTLSPLAKEQTVARGWKVVEEMP